MTNAVQHFEQLMLLPPALMALADVMTSGHAPRKAFRVNPPQLALSLIFVAYSSWALAHGLTAAALLGAACAACYGRLLWSRHLEASATRVLVARAAHLRRHPAR